MSSEFKFYNLKFRLTFLIKKKVIISLIKKIPLHIISNFNLTLIIIIKKLHHIF